MNFLEQFESELLQKLRPVKETDRGKLLTVSYSKLDLFKKCPYRYKLRYCDRNYAKNDTLATRFGSILHKALELKCDFIMKDEDVDYDYIHNTLLSGFDETTEKGHEQIIGIQEMRKLYFEDWYVPDPKTGLSPEDRYQTFVDKVLPERLEGLKRTIIGAEIPFEFVYDNRCIIHGFIDRVDAEIDEDDEIRALTVTDYKSSKKIYPVEEIRTPLQMVTYDLACLFMYGVIPDNHVYDFIGLDKQQTKINGVCTKGYLKRGVKKIDSLLDQINKMEEENEFPPSPTPLCYWCDFCENNPNTEEKYKYLCPYYSLWTPSNKTFQTNKQYESEGTKEPTKRREFIF